MSRKRKGMTIKKKPPLHGKIAYTTFPSDSKSRIAVFWDEGKDGVLIKIIRPIERADMKNGKLVQMETRKRLPGGRVVTYFFLEERCAQQLARLIPLVIPEKTWAEKLLGKLLGFCFGKNERVVIEAFILKGMYGQSNKPKPFPTP